MDSSELEETLLDKTTRQLKQIVSSDKNITSNKFDQLMGNSVIWRKELMENRSSEVEINV